jgi:cytochrome c oxidase subunit I
MSEVTMSEYKRPAFFSIGFVRGSIYLLLGTLVGMGIVSGIRLVMGLPAWHPNAAWTVGAIFGTAAFMVGVGAISDWWKWAKGQETPEHPEAPRYKGWAKYLSISFDHKVIGIQYGFTSLVLFLVAGLFALTFRTELAAEGMQFMGENATILGMNGLNFTTRS